jgi:hypothetical protein
VQDATEDPLGLELTDCIALHRLDDNLARRMVEQFLLRYALLGIKAGREFEVAVYVAYREHRRLGRGHQDLDHALVFAAHVEVGSQQGWEEDHGRDVGAGIDGVHVVSRYVELALRRIFPDHEREGFPDQIEKLGLGSHVDS